MSRGGGAGRTGDRARRRAPVHSGRSCTDARTHSESRMEPGALHFFVNGHRVSGDTEAAPGAPGSHPSSQWGPSGQDSVGRRLWVGSGSGHSCCLPRDPGTSHPHTHTCTRVLTLPAPGLWHTGTEVGVPAV